LIRYKNVRIYVGFGSASLEKTRKTKRKPKSSSFETARHNRNFFGFFLFRKILSKILKNEKRKKYSSTVPSPDLENVTATMASTLLYKSINVKERECPESKRRSRMTKWDFLACIEKQI
jgi:hypothetical protein